MRLTIPLTGTVIREGSVWGEGKLSGDPDDPIRPVDIDLGNVSWKMIAVDIENEEMEIEVSPGERVSEPTGEVAAEGKLVYTSRKATSGEKVSFLQQAKDLIEGHTKDDLYTMSKSKRLVKPVEAVELYKKKPPTMAARERVY